MKSKNTSPIAQADNPFPADPVKLTDPLAGVNDVLPDWRALSKAMLEREYSPSSCIGGNYLPFITAYKTQSRAAHARCVAMGASWQEVRYAEQPMQRLDLCLPAPLVGAAKPGLLVFIHGGYWQELSAQDSLFAAAACVERGMAFAALDYTLAPHASLPQIVDECRAAFACLMRQADDLGFDANNVVVTGSSAGAHLAAMIAAPGWHLADGSQVKGPKAAVLVSGIYDLEPLVATSINDALGMDAALAHDVSPMHLKHAGHPPTLVTWGSVETSEFKRQSVAYAAALHAAGSRCDALEILDKNHFDVILDLADISTALGQYTMGLLEAK